MGDTVVRVLGTGFLDSPLLSCLFGSTAVSAVWLREDILECHTPPMASGTEVALRVANNGVDFSPTYGLYRYQGKSAACLIALV